jgi:hypothetical protein
VASDSLLCLVGVSLKLVVVICIIFEKALSKLDVVILVEGMFFIPFSNKVKDDKYKLDFHYCACVSELKDEP